MAKYRNPRIEAEMHEVEQIEQEEKLMTEPAKTVEEETWKKRYGDQRRYLDQVKNEQKAKIEELENKLDQALRGQIRAPKSDADIDLWMKEYPEFAGILETIVQKRIKDATSTANQKIAALEEKSKELDQKEAFIALERRHPELRELLNSEEFHTWLKSQRQKLQDAIYSSLDVDDADDVIQKYKAQSKKFSKSKVEEEDFDFRNTAKVVRNSGLAEQPDADFGEYEFTESQIERESKRDRNWFSRNEDKIMSAASRGKIFYDISGGAR